MQPARKLSHGAFALLGVTTTVALLGFAAWLDRDMLDPAFEQQAAEVVAAETADFERGFAQGVHVSAARLKQAYEQGLQEGAAGMLNAVSGVNNLAATQACLALGQAPRAGLVAQRQPQRVEVQP